MAQGFRLLFSPIKIGSMTLKNRIVMCPHGFWFKDFVERGKVPTDRLIRYWEERAKGGVGMIGNYLTTVDPFTPDLFRTFRRADAKEGFGKAAETLHKYGTKFYVQLAHFGGEWGVFQPPGPVAPSAMPYDAHTGLPSFMPRALSTSEAEVIVSGGRGVGSAENFKLLETLAGMLGGTIACSRMALDEGWVSRDRLVGSTGSFVSPKAYLACGISGASQHLMGMRDSGFIVSINKDLKAPIFNVSDVAVEGDLLEILPRLIAELESSGK